jgi:hypothetical protein
MSMQKTLGALSIACALVFVGCDEEEDGPNDDDAGESHDHAERRDGGHHDDDEQLDDEQLDDEQPVADAGSADAGTSQGAHSDAGAANSDGGNGNATEDAGASNGKDASTSSSDGGLQTSGNGLFFFLPTGEPDNTSAPTVAVDGQGNTHSVFPAYAGGDAYYSLCKSDGSCTGSASAQVAHFQTDGTVANAMLVLTADGKPRILLSSYSQVYWGACEQNCGVRENWTFASILNHNGKKQITGEALALDPQGRPRFLMHTYRALFGIGQETPEETYAQCDAACENPASWRYTVVETGEIWDHSNLRFDAQGHAHVATTVVPFQGNAPDGDPINAYLQCDAAECGAMSAFRGTGFGAPFESMTEAVNMYPATSLALTKSGVPRVALIAKSAEGKKQLIYYACNSNCKDGKSWFGTILTQHDAIGAGVDLTLDATDHPRLVYTFNYNILLRFCDENDCTTETAKWDDGLVEAGKNIPADKIFLWENCTIGAWFLHSPSIALTTSGQPRVGYQARDISGGFTRPDPTKPGCTPGTDMTFARLAVMTSIK